MNDTATRDARPAAGAAENEARTGTSSIRQLFVERRRRGALYRAPSYWDARAAGRSGMARSLWPSNAFNVLWDGRQRALVTRSLGPLDGRTIVDVGCGTGRMSCWLAERGGAHKVVGVDFSAATVEAAGREAGALVSSGLVQFVQGDVVQGLDAVGVAAFDDALVLGCLSVACSDRSSLQRAVENVAKLVRPGGRVLLLEPIHRSPLLRRVLDLGVEEWIVCANQAGLALVHTDRMGFVPFRMVLSVRDLPRPLVDPLFQAGERLLDRVAWLSPLSDYKLLLFAKKPAQAP